MLPRESLAEDVLQAKNKLVEDREICFNLVLKADKCLAKQSSIT